MNTANDARDKIWGLIKDARVAMLTTQENEHLRSRPMAACQDNFDDGCLWFFTRADSPKTEQVTHEHEVNVAYANTDDNEYVSLCGRASVTNDRGAIEAHWSDMLKAWFPDGKDDPQLALLKVDVHQAQYWDAPSSTMVVAFDYLKARMGGGRPDMGEHRQVDLH